MKEQLNEGLDYHDFLGQIKPKITVDEYAAKMGKDSDIVTVTFTTNSKLSAEDLVSWLELGYSYILDASVSEGEVEPGKYLVFVEMNRRTSTSERIVEILNDLQTLTDVPLTDWVVQVDDEEYDADVDTLKQVIISSPHDYRVKKEDQEELNEMRSIAGLDAKSIYQDDDYIRGIKSLAGL